jgi:CRP-like cAMP-binding protein
MSDAMYVVIEGRVKLEKDGAEVLVVGESQSFGTWALFDSVPQLMTAVAIQDAQLLKITSEDFYEVLADHEDITPAIFKAVIERVRDLAPE